jgi:hypothetical protein
MTWRLAYALVSLRNAVNARWPGRDTASDGTVGDVAHQARSNASDHNPWIEVAGIGVVRALDTDVDGVDAGWFAEQLRLLGAAGDHRLTGGGYVIYNRRITRADWSGWSVYTGQNPHTAHVHCSFSRVPTGFDDGARTWPFLTGGPPAPAPGPVGRPVLQLGSTGLAVTNLQAYLKRVYPLYAKGLVTDGVFGPATKAAVVEFQRRYGLAADGIVGPATWRALGLA